MSFSRGKLLKSDSYSQKHVLSRVFNEDPNCPVSPPPKRRSFFSPPEHGRLPLLLRVRTVELDRGAGGDAKWGFSLRSIQVNKQTHEQTNKRIHNSIFRVNTTTGFQF